MNAPMSAPSAPRLREEAANAPSSGIIEVFNHGRDREGLIPLWAGEGDLPTPSFISEATAASLARGETFYTHQCGIPELRQALAGYHQRVYGLPSDPGRFFVTAGGMHAVQIAVRMAAGAGEEVIIPTPAWPNFAGALAVAGARPVAVPLTFGARGWQLDLDRLASAVTPRTRAIVINSPANPTGWTASREELVEILAIARRANLWIIADEIYARFVFDPALRIGTGRAPSFRDVMEDDDRVLFVQTFSKNWAMTGWRLGWLEAPASLRPVIENLIQYSTSGIPVFLQRGGIAAIEQGEDFLAGQIARAEQGRAIVARLNETGHIQLPAPAGAFYAFFKVRSNVPSRDIAIRLVDEANVGLAPGSAFGEGSEGYLRLCFLRKAEDVEEAIVRLNNALGRW